MSTEQDAASQTIAVTTWGDASRIHAALLAAVPGHLLTFRSAPPHHIVLDAGEGDPGSTAQAQPS